MEKVVTKRTLVLFISIVLIATSSQAENSQEPDTQKIDGYMKKAGQFYEMGKYAEAIAYYRKAADGGNAWGQNNLAWILATFKHSEFRNGELAVCYALKAVEQEPKNAAFVQTLAAAYARNNEFDKAVETQRRVLTLLQDEHTVSKELRELLQKDHKEKLTLYQNQNAYIDEN